MTNQIISVKKNTERIRICVLFVISPLFRQCHCHKPIATKFFFFFHPISVMPLSQIHSHKFFFPSISAMALPKTTWNKFFSLLFRQCHCHNSIPLFFVIEERDKPNCFSKKKYWKNKNMRTFFYISPLFQQCHCHKQQFFFFYYVLFFCFCSQRFRIRIFYLCFEYLFYCFCLHHFRIRILYLSLQRVSCT